MFMTTFRSIQTRRNVIREDLKLCKERRERRHLQNDRNRVITPFPGQLTINQREQSGKGVVEQKKRLHLLEKHLFL